MFILFSWQWFCLCRNCQLHLVRVEKCLVVTVTASTCSKNIVLSFLPSYCPLTFLLDLAICMLCDSWHLASGYFQNCYFFFSYEKRTNVSRSLEICTVSRTSVNRKNLNVFLKIFLYWGSFFFFLCLTVIAVEVPMLTWHVLEQEYPNFLN